MSVEVKLELGHRAIKRESITQEGFTHDWTVFVRGAEGNNIHYFVEKVVFHLHDSFPKPKRVVKEPPYSVSESGYAGFIMPIEVYFRTREEPKKVTFRYDLYLRLEQPPVNNIRIEKLTFQNPSDDFRNKLLKAGGLAGTLSASAAGGSASLSTQACAPPPQNTDDHQSNHPKVGEKKPRSHVPSKELPIKPAQPPPPKPSQPFTDIFGAPIRTKSSPDSSSVKSKESGHSSQTKNKVTQNNSSSACSTKEGKSSSKESHKSKDSHHSNKESHHSTKESSHSSKDSHPSKDTHHSSKEIHLPKDSQQQLKDSHSSKESHHSTKETHHAVKEHSKEGHKTKDNHHSSKGGKSSKDSRPSESKDGKQSKSSKSDKELNKTSSTKRAAPTDSHSSHGNVEKKKKTSPVSSESSDKSSSQSKHKIKEGKEKTEKHKVKSLGNSVKKEEEKPKPKSSPAKSSPAPPPPAPAEPKDMPKPKPNSPFKEPSVQPSPVMKPPSPVSGEGGKPSDSSSMDSDSDESHKSFYNKAEYSSPASGISESSLHGGNRISGLLSDNSIVSPLSDEEDDSSSFFHKRKHSSDYELDVSSPEFKTTENKPMPKLKKKHHSHHKSSKSKPAENYHRGNGSINNDITMHHSPTHDQINNSINNTAYREELLELQRIIMSLSDRKVLQNIVDLIEKTGKYQVTNTTFDFDLCSLDPAIIQKIRLCLTSCDKYV